MVTNSQRRSSVIVSSPRQHLRKSSTKPNQLKEKQKRESEEQQNLHGLSPTDPQAALAKRVEQIQSNVYRPQLARRNQNASATPNAALLQ